jgi:glutaminyl-peptide cyclotransferase
VNQIARKMLNSNREKLKENLMKTLILVLLTFFVGNTLAGGNFNADSAFRFLTRQTDLGPRNPGSAAHKACLNYLQKEMEKFGGQVTLQPFMHYDLQRGFSLTMTNVIASFQPENKSRIMLCAHWDTRPMADQDSPENFDTPILGANDGASGVAVLLELARQFHKSPPPVGVDLVLFDGEDYGSEGDLDNYCLGSRYFVDNNRKYFPRFAILLDMIGDAQLDIPIEGYSQQYAPQVVKLVWNAAANLGVSQFYPYVKHYIFDDHVILNEGGIPAIDIIDFEYPDESHRYWHTLEDTPDKCSPASLKAVGDVLMKVIYELTP